MDDIDIYNDLEDFNEDVRCSDIYGESKNSFVEKNKQLEQKIEELTGENEKLLAENTILKKNISSLYKTARNDIAQKQRRIDNLVKELDDIKFRRNTNGKRTINDSIAFLNNAKRFKQDVSTCTSPIKENNSVKSSSSDHLSKKNQNVIEYPTETSVKIPDETIKRKTDSTDVVSISDNDLLKLQDIKDANYESIELKIDEDSVSNLIHSPYKNQEMHTIRSPDQLLKNEELIKSDSMKNLHIDLDIEYRLRPISPTESMSSGPYKFNKRVEQLSTPERKDPRFYLSPRSACNCSPSPARDQIHDRSPVEPDEEKYLSVDTSPKSEFYKSDKSSFKSARSHSPFEEKRLYNDHYRPRNRDYHRRSRSRSRSPPYERRSRDRGSYRYHGSKWQRRDYAESRYRNSSRMSVSPVAGHLRYSDNKYKYQRSRESPRRYNRLGTPPRVINYMKDHRLDYSSFHSGSRKSNAIDRGTIQSPDNASIPKVQSKRPSADHLMDDHIQLTTDKEEYEFFNRSETPTQEWNQEYNLSASPISEKDFSLDETSDDESFPSQVEQYTLQYSSESLPSPFENRSNTPHENPQSEFNFSISDKSEDFFQTSPRRHIDIDTYRRRRLSTADVDDKEVIQNQDLNVETPGAKYILQQKRTQESMTAVTTENERLKNDEELKMTEAKTETDQGCSANIAENYLLREAGGQSKTATMLIKSQSAVSAQQTNKDISDSDTQMQCVDSKLINPSVEKTKNENSDGIDQLNKSDIQNNGIETSFYKKRIIINRKSVKSDKTKEEIKLSPVVNKETTPNHSQVENDSSNSRSEKIQIVKDKNLQHMLISKTDNTEESMDNIKGITTIQPSDDNKQKNITEPSKDIKKEINTIGSSKDIKEGTNAIEPSKDIKKEINAIEPSKDIKNGIKTIETSKDIKKVTNAIEISKDINKETNAIESSKDIKKEIKSKDIKNGIKAIEISKDIKKITNAIEISKDIKKITNAIEISKDINKATNAIETSKNIKKGTNAIEPSKDMKKGTNAIDRLLSKDNKKGITTTSNNNKKVINITESSKDNKKVTNITEQLKDNKKVTKNIEQLKKNKNITNTIKGINKTVDMRKEISQLSSKIVKTKTKEQNLKKAASKSIKYITDKNKRKIMIKENNDEMIKEKNKHSETKTSEADSETKDESSKNGGNEDQKRKEVIKNNNSNEIPYDVDDITKDQITGEKINGMDTIIQKDINNEIKDPVQKEEEKRVSDPILDNIDRMMKTIQGVVEDKEDNSNTKSKSLSDYVSFWIDKSISAMIDVQPITTRRKSSEKIEALKQTLIMEVENINGNSNETSLLNLNTNDELQLIKDDSKNETLIENNENISPSKETTDNVKQMPINNQTNSPSIINPVTLKTAHSTYCKEITNDNKVRIIVTRNRRR